MYPLKLVYGNPYLRSSTAIDNSFYHDYSTGSGMGGNNGRSSIGGYTPPLPSGGSNSGPSNDYSYGDYVSGGGGGTMRPASNLVSTEYVIRQDMLGSSLATHV